MNNWVKLVFLVKRKIWIKIVLCLWLLEIWKNQKMMSKNSIIIPLIFCKHKGGVIFYSPWKIIFDRAKNFPNKQFGISKKKIVFFKIFFLSTKNNIFFYLKKIGWMRFSENKSAEIDQSSSRAIIPPQDQHKFWGSHK